MTVSWVPLDGLLVITVSVDPSEGFVGCDGVSAHWMTWS